MQEALLIQVRGIVQGVGFRPFVYRQARLHLIKGWVCNAVDGVVIHGEGEAAHLDGFIAALVEQGPPAARVESIEMNEVPLEGFTSFEIRNSDEAEVQRTTLVSPDLASCDACIAELFDERNRRYRYPFINCTDCGPRYTIIDHLPYDRPSTSMAGFQLCKQCAAEYEDPGNRRFHAQPNACFECGPRLSFSLTGQEEVSWAENRAESDALIARAVALLTEGKILAIKGLSGFHLACDASNPQAVSRLRARKGRDGKPFACMVARLGQARRYVEINEAEAEVLQSPVRPIVLLKKRPAAPISPGLADGLTELGLMLPTTPLQHLILHDFGSMLVMTSGNYHDEPIVIDDDEARQRLSAIADGMLGHDRPILARFDDSVLRVIDLGQGEFATQVIRRARGLAPAPLSLPSALDLPPQAVSLFATGSEQKNTFCLTRGAEAFLSPHIGDLEDSATFDAWLATKQAYERLFAIDPVAVVCDKHPEYLTSKWAHHQPLNVYEVQHHHAHVVATMAEHDSAGPVCGIAFDGTGFGEDGAIWGGEVLLSNLETFERVANFAYVPMPGGAAAIKYPDRMAYGLLWAYDLLDHPGAADLLERLGEERSILETMVEQGINCPVTSSVGRLFDGVSALLGICSNPSYEGEAAVRLEAAMNPELAGEALGSRETDSAGGALDRASDDCAEDLGGDSRSTGRAAGSARGCELARVDVEGSKSSPAARAAHASSYEVKLVKNSATSQSTAQDTSVLLMDAEQLLRAILDDKAAGLETAHIARRFHEALVDAVVELASFVEALYDCSAVALCGGVFMNRYLIEHSAKALIERGFTVMLNKELPPNDGSMSYGQAVVAWARRKAGDR